MSSVPAEKRPDLSSIENLIASSVDMSSIPESGRFDASIEEIVTPTPTSLRPLPSPFVGTLAGPSIAPPPSGPGSAKTPPRHSLLPLPEDASREEKLAVHVNRNDWKTVAADLGPLNGTKALTPTLGLLAAIAHNEADPASHSEAVAVAIRATGQLLGLREESPIVRVLARRILRKNPGTFSEREAPPARTGVMIVLVTAALGAAIGWLLSGGFGVARAAVMQLLK